MKKVIINRNLIGIKVHENKRGITLIALVVGTVILLILAGITINLVFSEDGIFKKAEQAEEAYKQAKAKEILEIVLSDAQMQKHTKGLTDEQLTEKINEVGEEIEERENPNISKAIVEGYIFEIDRTVPKIIGNIENASGVKITAEINGLLNGWVKPSEVKNISVTGTIKTYDGGEIINVSATKGGAEITEFSINAEGKYTIDNITEDTTIVITAEDSNENLNSKVIPITIKIDGTVPTIEKINGMASIVEDRYVMKINVSAHDQNSEGKEESGVKVFNYKITPQNGIEGDKATGTFEPNQTIEILTTDSRDYKIGITAEDNAGNKLSTVWESIPTGGKIKHINTLTGLKEVNTLDIYGASVKGYTCKRTDAEWQIFYIDEEDEHRVYLIAKDYMDPPTQNTELNHSSGYFNAYGWNTTVLDKYKTIIPEKDETTNLGKFMSKFLSEIAGMDASKRENFQATNYMLDQKVWSEYKGNLAYVALGGPTLPLLANANNDVAVIGKNVYYKADSLGYQAKFDNGNWSYSIGYIGTRVDRWSTQKKEDGARSMWIATPCGNLTPDTQMFNLKDDGGYLSDMYARSQSVGFRPVVALDSSVKFIENEDGTYSIDN